MEEAEKSVEKCVHYDCAQGRHKCCNEKVKSNRCLGVCSSYEENVAGTSIDFEKLNSTIKKLNSHFFKSLIRFDKSENLNLLPTIEIKLKHNKYLSEEFFTFKDNFRPELLKVLEKCGITDVSFNNTGHTFWYTDK